jgi:hypothetical protein
VGFIATGALAVEVADGRENVQCKRVAGSQQLRVDACTGS